MPDAAIGEARAAHLALFGGVHILGLSEIEQWAVTGRAMAARRGLNGHSIETVAELLEGLAFGELPPTALARELVGGVMDRARHYIGGH